MSCHFLLPASSIFTVPANVPISMKISGPQALTGPKASGLDKQLVNASICCSVQGRDVSRRNGTAMLHFEEKYSGLNPNLRIICALDYSLKPQKSMFVVESEGFITMYVLMLFF